MVNHYCFSDFGKYSDRQLYYFGWLAGDGCISKSKYSYTISLRLQKSDKEFMQRYGEFVDIKNLILNSRNLWRAQVNSSVMARSLFEVGITERKSKSLCVNYKLASSPLFWRGYFEANGCISWDNYSKVWRMNLAAGSCQILIQWCEFINIPTKYIYPTKNEQCFVFRIAKKKELLRLFKILYNNPDESLVLERKWLLVNKLLGNLT
jgi:hypothetical protein